MSIYLSNLIYLSIYISILSIYLSCICLASKYLVYWLYPLYTDNLLIQPVLDAIHSPPILPPPPILLFRFSTFSGKDHLHSLCTNPFLSFTAFWAGEGGGWVPKPPSSIYAPYSFYFINHFLFQFFLKKPMLERTFFSLSFCVFKINFLIYIFPYFIATLSPPSLKRTTRKT